MSLHQKKYLREAASTSSGEPSKSSFATRFTLEVISFPMLTTIAVEVWTLPLGDVTSSEKYPREAASTSGDPSKSSFATRFTLEVTSLYFCRCLDFVTSSEKYLRKDLKIYI